MSIDGLITQYMDLSHIHLAVLICQNIWATRHSNLAYYSRYVLDPLILWIVNTIDSISDANYVKTEPSIM